MSLTFDSAEKLAFDDVCIEILCEVNSLLEHVCDEATEHTEELISQLSELGQECVASVRKVQGTE